MIPLQLHFFWCSSKRPIGPLEEYVLQEAMLHSGCTVTLHTDQAGYTLGGIMVHDTTFPTQLHGKPIKHVEHAVDFVRFTTMKQCGGFAADLDMVFRKSLQPLAMHHDHVFAYQNKAYKTVCIGFFGCMAHSELISQAAAAYEQRFPPKQYWGSASFRKLVPDILQGNHVVLPQTALFPLRMKDECFTDPSVPLPHHRMRSCLAVHLWGHHLRQHGTEDMVLQKLSSGSSLAQEL